MATAQDVTTLQNFIDGQQVPPSGKTEPVLNPATGEELARAGNSTAEDVDRAVAYFRAKVEGYDVAETGSAPAQILVGLLARLERYPEAIEISLRYLTDVNPSELACPNALQLCYLAGDFDRLKSLSRERGDLLNYVAQALAVRAF